MASPREVFEGVQIQGEDEEIIYSVDVTKWGDSPSSLAVVAKDPDGNDVSGIVLSGSPSSVGNVITTPVVLGLTPGQVYRIEVQFTIDGQVLECFFRIEAEE